MNSSTTYLPSKASPVAQVPRATGCPLKLLLGHGCPALTANSSDRNAGTPQGVNHLSNVASNAYHFSPKEPDLDDFPSESFDSPTDLCPRAIRRHIPAYTREPAKSSTTAAFEDRCPISVADSCEISEPIKTGYSAQYLPDLKPSVPELKGFLCFKEAQPEISIHHTLCKPGNRLGLQRPGTSKTYLIPKCPIKKEPTDNNAAACFNRGNVQVPSRSTEKDGKLSTTTSTRDMLDDLDHNLIILKAYEATSSLPESHFSSTLYSLARIPGSYAEQNISVCSRPYRTHQLRGRLIYISSILLKRPRFWSLSPNRMLILLLGRSIANFGPNSRTYGAATRSDPDDIGFFARLEISPDLGWNAGLGNESETPLGQNVADQTISPQQHAKVPDLQSLRAWAKIRGFRLVPINRTSTPLLAQPPPSAAVLPLDPHNLSSFQAGPSGGSTFGPDIHPYTPGILPYSGTAVQDNDYGRYAYSKLSVRGLI
ncbi:hypothetical protein RhiJN_23613 [Ceratobasidium sp. AG-Ba]|nr:hypothetical protein RhiJN_23613 [Ceratobasidium sp. AG-Ba]